MVFLGHLIHHVDPYMYGETHVFTLYFSFFFILSLFDSKTLYLIPPSSERVCVQCCVCGEPSQSGYRFMDSCDVAFDAYGWYRAFILEFCTLPLFPSNGLIF